MKVLRIVSIILMALGLLIVISGPIARIQHWPEIKNGIYIGLILGLIGVIILITGIKKNKVP
jgi:hypothetical protein